MVFTRCVIIGILLFMAVFFGLGLWLPDRYTVEHSCIIERPHEEVYAFVSDVRNRYRWDPITADSTVTYSFTYREDRIGSSWRWEGRRSGSGILTIETMQPNELIRDRFVLRIPVLIEADFTWLFTDLENMTRVTWRAEGELDYPVGRVVGFFIEDLLGPDLDSGLERLKRVMEAEGELRISS